MGVSRIGRLSSNPLRPSNRAAVKPARDACGPARSNAALRSCLSVSGPDCATTTPRAGCCQRPDLIRQRNWFSVINRSACDVLRTHSRSASTSSRRSPSRFMHSACVADKELSLATSNLWITSVDNAISIQGTWRFRRPGDGIAILLVSCE